jgi:L-fuconate dehydratase
MKVGSEKVEDDVERARWIKEEIGERTLMMDANQKWDVQTAISSMKALSKYDPLWIEEPTHADDVCGHRDINNSLKEQGVKCRVATGEVAQNKVIFKQLIMEKAIDFCQIDAGRMSGGPSEIMSVMLMAAKHNVKIVPHAGGVGLCELVRQYSFIDFVCFTGKMLPQEGQLCEATDHLHEHFHEEIVFKQNA